MGKVFAVCHGCKKLARVIRYLFVKSVGSEGSNVTVTVQYLSMNSLSKLIDKVTS